MVGLFVELRIRFYFELVFNIAFASHGFGNRHDSYFLRIGFNGATQGNLASTVMILMFLAVTE